MLGRKLSWLNPLERFVGGSQDSTTRCRFEGVLELESPARLNSHGEEILTGRLKTTKGRLRDDSEAPERRLKDD